MWSAPEDGNKKAVEELLNVLWSHIKERVLPSSSMTGNFTIMPVTVSFIWGSSGQKKEAGVRLDCEV